MRMLTLLGFHQERHALTQAMLDKRREENIQHARDIGISIKHYHHRINKTEKLTTLNKQHHNRMGNFKYHFKVSTNKKTRSRLEREFSNFTTNYNKIFNEEIYRPYRPAWKKDDDIHSDASDDTRQLEYRPNKRSVKDDTNLNNYESTNLSKKPCSTTDPSTMTDEIQEIEIEWFPDLYDSNHHTFTTPLTSASIRISSDLSELPVFG
ncbi:hypothetical protein C1646_669846 [Rhizophagus diaphanus]|nr:hypothetical protein C1646_669846 [Rhizophagus diaphanus] [Rhizophagus sp. MUCL 43196]